jgi:hypothetical protein
MSETTTPLGHKGISQVLAETPLGTNLTNAAASAAANAQVVAEHAAEVAGKAEQVAGDLALSGTALGATLAARDQAETSAASANALNPAITADAGRTDRALIIQDDFGQTVLEVSQDGSTIYLPSLTIRRLPDGSSRLSFAGGASSLDLKADGSIAGGGVTTVPAASDLYAYSIEDTSGFVAFGVGLDGALTLGGFRLVMSGSTAILKAADGTTLLSAAPGTSPVIAGAISTREVDRSDLAFAIEDANGWIALAVKTDGTVVAPGLTGQSGASSTGFTAADIAAANAHGVAMSTRGTRQRDTTTQRLTAAFNHVIAYGQSLSNGAEAWPALSTTARYGNLMVGTTVRGKGTTTWTPTGDTVFHPLVETVSTSGGTILSPTDVAALPPGDTTSGETVMSAALNMLKRLATDARGLADDPAHALVGSVCGANGQTIAALSKGASPEYYNRVPTCAAAGKAAAQVAGGDYAIPAVLYLQGESDYAAGIDRVTYKASLLQLAANLRADVQQGVAGQGRPFGFFTHQAGGSWTKDGTGLGVGQAQWELSEEQPNWYLVAPSYPVTDKVSGHLDANGSRWLGCQFGKVLYRVLVLGQRWRPLSPVAAQRRGREMMITMNVPEPPLVFDTPIVGNVATDYALKGFSAADDSGAVPLLSAEIVGDTVVRLVAGRDIVGTLSVSYATEAGSAGNGCLRDSDPMLADDLYTYTAGSGQYASANIPALVGKPYPLWNWCIAFRIAATPA